MKIAQKLTCWDETVARVNCIRIFECEALLTPWRKSNWPVGGTWSNWELDRSILRHPEERHIIHKSIWIVLWMNEACIRIHADGRSINENVAEIDPNGASIVHTIGSGQQPELIQNRCTAKWHTIRVIIVVLDRQQCVPWELSDRCVPTTCDTLWNI